MKEPEKTIERNKKHRKKMKNLWVIQNIIFLACAILHIVIGLYAESCGLSIFSYCSAALFLGALIMNLVNYINIKFYYRMEDLWMNAYFNLVKHIGEARKCQEKAQKKKTLKK